MELAGKSLVITGIGGFIGRRLAEIAREQGMRVSGVELELGSAERMREAGFAVSLGDVRNRATLETAFRGADVVCHTAAVVEAEGDWDRFRSINVGGTRSALQAAQAVGARHFVHLSSVMVHGFEFPPKVTEDGEKRGEDNPYCQTKIESEELAVSWHAPGVMEVTVIRPGDVYGPGSEPWVLAPLRFMKRGVFALPNAGRGILNHVYIDNLVDAILLAVEKDAGGEVFTVTDGVETTCRAYFDQLASVAGLKPPPALPAFLLEGISRAASRATPAPRELAEARRTRAALAFLMRPAAYSIDKARERLGYEPKIDLREGLSRTRQWLDEQHLP